MKKLRFTGERIVPDDMTSDVENYQRHLARYTLALQFCTNRDVLDAACGTGYGSMLISTVARTVVSIDVSDKAVAYGKSHYPSNIYPNITWRVENLDSYAPELDAYGCIVSYETVEHLDDPKAFLSKLRQSLSFDGRIIASMPINNPGEFHKHVFNYQNVLELFSSCDLSIEHILGQYELNFTISSIDTAPYLIIISKNSD